ncbi:MAG: hypothetical protein ACYS8W_09620 [Planctomycetota bacterium]|jgi:hypothetical protein
MKKSLPLISGAIIVIVFSLLIAGMFMYRPLKLRWYGHVLETGEPAERLAAIEKLFSIPGGERIIEDKLLGRSPDWVRENLGQPVTELPDPELAGTLTWAWNCVNMSEIIWSSSIGNVTVIPSAATSYTLILNNGNIVVGESLDNADSGVSVSVGGNLSVLPGTGGAYWGNGDDITSADFVEVSSERVMTHRRWIYRKFELEFENDKLKAVRHRKPQSVEDFLDLPQ